VIPNWAKVGVVLIGLAMAAVVVAPASGSYEGRVFSDLAALQGEFVNRPVPDFELHNLNGKAFKLSDYRGKVVFLNLWATWCKPCRDELPSMVQLAAKLEAERESFVMIAVAWDNDPEAMGEFLASMPQVMRNMVIARDPDGQLTNQLGTRKLPETYIIDQEGQIVARFANMRDWDSDLAKRIFLSLIRRQL